MVISNGELSAFLAGVSFDAKLLNDYQYDQLCGQISVLKGLKGIKNKFNEITGELKVHSVLSELSFACLFAKLNFDVELIYDGHARFIKNNKKIKSPDFIATVNGDEYFVEVTSFGASDPNEELRRVLNDEIKKYPLCFWVHFPEIYSLPCITSDDYESQKERIRMLSEKIKSHLPSYKAIRNQVEIEDCIVHFKQLPVGEEGYIDMGVTSYLIPVEKISKHVEKRLVEKSEKLQSWHEPNKPKYYLLALDIRGFQAFPYGLLHLLYGPITYYNHNDFIEKKPECYYLLRGYLDSVDYDLLDDRHKRFLFQVGYDISRQSIVSKLGIFMEKKEAFSGITGVLVSSNNSFQYLPNPCSLNSSSKLIDYLDLPLVPEIFGKYLE
ncbi:hypothetical protein [Chlorobium ferrooxidans]|uniref:Uncharacterized protein n=1 Tax=Chlorobium ferrooxidans DSM 13031 TaxID=377431 RepID=Q0YP99_9CHLB|nr:hypothetical protein [Chlorobium ferrooxidans]EAT58128.1 hypothetical protein CferDRAFT_0135 [Chlorobium ferrooxidans DSM 13031]